ncbi:MAG: hypothetical protein SH847_23590 [Roseiflexaceae bacterium]|nr:hypothetical protein [Roseiflexaceae bacterium]
MDDTLRTEWTHSGNMATVVGVLELQTIRGHELIRIIRRNELQGSADQIVLQVPSPFGHSYALPLELGRCVTGIDLMTGVSSGTRLAVSGRLIWEQHTDMRFSLDGEPSRKTNDLVFHVEAIRLANDQEQPGCDVQLSGVIRSAPRIMRHPYRPGVLLAATTLQVSIEQQRTATRSRMFMIEQVPIVVPLQHPDAPNLLRPGNRVAVEGMLERIVIDLQGPDVEQAIATLDAEWETRRIAITDADTLRQAERRHQRERRKLAQATRNRVVVGYVELIEGTPASPREAQAIRRASVRAKRNGDHSIQQIISSP